jgi:hypothetical protein
MLFMDSDPLVCSLLKATWAGAQVVRGAEPTCLEALLPGLVILFLTGFRSTTMSVGGAIAQLVSLLIGFAT